MSPPTKASPAPMISTTTGTSWAGTSTSCRTLNSKLIKMAVKKGLTSSEVASMHPSAPVVIQTNLEPHSFAKNLASTAKQLVQMSKRERGTERGREGEGRSRGGREERGRESVCVCVHCGPAGVHIMWVLVLAIALPTAIPGLCVSVSQSL